MKILVKTDFISKCQLILNIFHIDDDDYIENWINEYIKQEIKKEIKKEDKKENICEISYEIESNFTEFSLIQKDKIINKGYIYNNNTLNYKKLFTININNYTESLTDTCIILQKNLPYTKLYNDINEEINKRIIKQLSKDTLCLLLLEYNKKMQIKNTWTQKELILLQNTIIKKYEIQLFNTISKQLRKNNKKQKRNYLLNQDEVLENQILKSCKLEYITLSRPNF